MGGAFAYGSDAAQTRRETEHDRAFLREQQQMHAMMATTQGCGDLTMAEPNLTSDEKAQMVEQFKQDLYLNAAVESDILASAQRIADHIDAQILESMRVKVARISSEGPS